MAVAVDHSQARGAAGAGASKSMACIQFREFQARS